MKRTVIPGISLLMLVLSCSTWCLAKTPLSNPLLSDGYEISIQFKPYKNCAVSLGHYFGDEFQLDTTALMDEKSEAVFKGNTRLPEGIYMVFIEGREDYFDFLVDNNQRFSIIAEVTEKDNSIRLKFTDSPDNELLSEYKVFMAAKERDIVFHQAMLSKATHQNDSLKYIRELSNIDAEIQEYRSKLVAKHPESFLSTLLKALREPLLPVELRKPENSADSVAARYYIKEHYWDGVNFWDDRLLYTPFFSPKLDKYFSEIVGRHADSVIQKIDWMMSTAVANENMTNLILVKLLSGSMNHRFKWDDSVFIHLFEKYVASKSYTWLTPTALKTITEQAYLLMGNTKGSPAADIELPGTDGRTHSLFAMDAKYTLLCFWDPTCEHCVETLPVMDSMYHAKWRNEGIKIYAVAVETGDTRENWLNFVRSNNLQAWTNVYNSMEDENKLAMKGLPLTVQKYDVWYYPSFFLLDSEKRFLAKKLTYPQVAELIESILNKG